MARQAGAKSRDLAIPIPSQELSTDFKDADLSFAYGNGHKFTCKMSQPEATASDQAPSNISATAHAYQSIQHQQSSTPTSAASPAADMAKDIVMSDRTPDRPAVS